MSPSAPMPTATSDSTTDALSHVLAETEPSLKARINSTKDSVFRTELASFDASKLTYTYTTTPGTIPDIESPEVWVTNSCTDHMITCSWTAGGGWGIPELKP